MQKSLYVLFICVLGYFTVVPYFVNSSDVYGAERTKLINDWKFRRGDCDEPAWRFTWRNLEPYA